MHPCTQGEAVAGVARRTQRLFEIIRQLPALLGPESSSSFLLSSVRISVWSNSCRQLGASHTLTLAEQLFYPHGLCLRTKGLDLTQWACFVLYQDNSCDCFSRVFSPSTSRLEDTEHVLLFACLTPGKTSLLLYVYFFTVNLHLLFFASCVNFHIGIVRFYIWG